MQIIVHRGTHQIGGCATEIKTERARILVDFGSELDTANPSELYIAGVTDNSEKCDAVLFTHCHGDHIGLMNTINAEVPLYIGELSKKMVYLSNERQHIYDIEHIQRMKTFTAGEEFVIGDIKITPFLVDHSAFDSYMFLIEAEGKKVLHTGDFRGHGFRGKGLSKVLDSYIGKVDVLICEGTVLNRSSQKSFTEYELSQKAKKLFEDNKYVFIICSSSNIDRIAAFCSAVPSGKYCICDDYQKEVLKLIEESSGVYSSLYRFPKMLTYGRNLDEKINRLGFCMFIRLGNSAHREIMEKYKKENPLVIYSMWQGYLENEVNRNYLGDFRLEYLHTSGHADIDTIKMLINKTNPEAIIPIHTENAEGFMELSKNTKILNDKQIFCI